MGLHCPRIIIGAERGGAGKTTLSLGLLVAWRRQGRRVQAFKKGPDYIDAAWLAAASGRACRNLDTYLMGEETVARSFGDHALRDDGRSPGVNLIEGNRGLFDGVDSTGSYSTAELAKLLDCPVVVALDCVKRTRTAAAMALGCQRLDPDVRIAGFILNRLATARQERVTRAAVEGATGLPVLGAVPRISRPAFRERHLGLVPVQEDERGAAALDQAAEVAERYLDVDRLWRIACDAPPLSLRLESASPSALNAKVSMDGGPRIGFFHDRAFHFYYPENIEALQRQGARLTAINALVDSALPEDLDGLYIGGGFPEESAAALSANVALRDAVKRAAEAGLPIYAECGGLMYLGRSLTARDERHEMAGVFPVSFALQARPQGHGYAEAVTTDAHPFLEANVSVKGHEFHYSRPVEFDLDSLRFALRMERGHGFSDGQDGLTCGNVFATYVHTHALGAPWWAESFVKGCRSFSQARRGTVGLASNITPGQR